MKLVLASGSENRQAILKAVGIPFSLHPARINEEEIMAETPKKTLIAIAKSKVEEVSKYEPNQLILGADTNGFYRNRLIAKPKYKMEALEILKNLSGKTHTMMTGWYILNNRNKRFYFGASETKITFLKLDEGQLINYVNDYPVLNWAAAYSPMNTMAAGFIESISGSLTGFTHGLPMEQIMPILKNESVI